MRDWRSAAETLAQQGSARTPEPRPLRLRQGLVVAVNAGSFPTLTVDLQLGGDTTSTIPAVAVLRSYVPRVNDVVWVAVNGTDLVVLVPTGGDATMPYAENVVTTTVSVSAAVAGTQAISFAASRFTVAPLVVMQVSNSSLYVPYVAVAPTTSGMTVGVRHVDNASGTASINVTVFAKQMTPLAAAG